ncbi:MAG: AraC family transcriptional regulator [Thiohalocapsa sp.]|nr:AraC family transcriptional regulator [Thiohalocapsa sp.]
MISASPGSGRLSAVGDGAAPLVYRAIDILREEMADPPGLSELAHRVGTNHARPARAFQTHLGMTAYDYLREQRLARARELLATTDRQVQQIADAVGFKRAGNFATAFRLRFGITPREYRRRHG